LVCSYLQTEPNTKASSSITAELNSSKSEDPEIYLIGNKIDLTDDRVVFEQEAKEFAAL
jgi:hypothetical protein